MSVLLPVGTLEALDRIAARLVLDDGKRHTRADVHREALRLGVDYLLFVAANRHSVTGVLGPRMPLMSIPTSIPLPEALSGDLKALAVYLNAGASDTHRHALAAGLHIFAGRLKTPRPAVPLFCPRCDKGHADEGPWAKRPHKTHLCVNDAYGAGCGHMWDVVPRVFGLVPLSADGLTYPPPSLGPK